MREEFEKSGRANLRNFWMRRALRILPPFYIVLLCAAAVSPITVSGVSLTAQALHMSNYWIITKGYEGIPMGTGVYWSLAVEEHFYLLFPWAFIALQKLRARVQAVLIYAMCLTVLVWRFALIEMHVSTDRTYMASDTRIDSILFGCALAVWCSPVIQPLRLNERRWKYLWCPSSLALLVVCLIVRNEVFRETVRYSLQGVALTGIFISAIRFPNWLPFRALNTKAMVFLGLLSYSLYLLHFVVLGNLLHRFPAMNGVARSILALTISVALSWLMYIIVERPCARLRRHLEASKSDRANPPINPVPS